MKKIYTVIVFLLASAAVFVMFNRQEMRIKREIGIDVSSANKITDYDTHSGNGDGVSCIIYNTQGTGIRQQIEKNPDWTPLPADDTVHTLLWGMSSESRRSGPYVTDSDGNPLVNYTDNGYYILIDRHSMGGEILERGSFNFTVALYDADSRLLYYCKLDT